VTVKAESTSGAEVPARDHEKPLEVAPRGPLGPLLRRVGVTRLLLSAEQRDAVERTLYPRARIGGPGTRNFLVLSLLSSAIAAMGLLLDSAPAVIGAMLLGPFITPLLASAGALVQGSGRRLGQALLMTLFGITLSVGAAAVVGWIVGAQLTDGNLPAQLGALTRPGLLDLGIAFAAGIAAGYATLRTEAGGALSGVAVSVTIEPPLAAIGLFLAAGNHDALRQSLLAMVTNFGALVVGATAAMAWWGFGDRAGHPEKSSARVRWGVAVWVVALAAVAVPLTLYSRQVVANQRFEDQVSAAVAVWDPSVRITSLDAEITGDHATVTLGLQGPRTPEPAWRLAEILSTERGVQVTVDVSFVLAGEDHAVASP